VTSTSLPPATTAADRAISAASSTTPAAVSTETEAPRTSASPTVEAPGNSDLPVTCERIRGSLAVAPPPGWSVTCSPWRPIVAGQADISTATITLYVATDDTDVWLRRALGHEIGHAYDDYALTWDDRARWEQERGFSAPWYPVCACADFDHGAGDFAESFMYTFLPEGRSYFSSQLAPPPSDDQQAFLQALLA
jgi:hypothetical protein